MEALSESNIDIKNKGFFSHVFNFDDENKDMLTNMFQYSFLSLPLVLIVLKLINYFSPEENDEKGNLEILLEVILTLTSILLAIWFINKIIMYIPTYSKTKYAEFNEITFILPFLILLFTMQTKIGTKINILIERLIDVYEGRTNLREQEKNSDIKKTQPISGPPVHQNSQADSLVRQNNVNQQFNNQATNQPPNQVVNQQPRTDYNNMFAGPNTPMIDTQEPLAANEGLGGGIFGGSVF